MTRIKRVLIIVTNTSEYELMGYRTGLWLGELTHFWDLMKHAGYEMDIASPSGGYVPIDPESLIISEVGHVVGIKGDISKRYADRAFMNLLRMTPKIADVDEGNYDGIYLTGGHGVMFDFPHNTGLAELTARFYEARKIVAAVCHGPAGLLEVTLSNGDYLLKGKSVTGFSWNEEALAKRQDAVPFNLEEELRKRGATYSKALVPFSSYVVEDRHLITGQNPGSAAAVAEAVVANLRAAHSAIR